jgi:hypothetical protein
MAAPQVPATRATVTNNVQLKGTVQSDPSVPVRSTAAGKVVFLFVDAGVKVAKGDKLFQIQSPVVPESSADGGPAVAGGTAMAGAAQATVVPMKPVYRYTDVTAPADGTLSTLTVLLNQQLSVGDVSGAVQPGSYSVSASVNASQQYRLLAKPSTAQVFVAGGPGPFDCPGVQLKNNAGAADGAGSSASGTRVAGGGGFSAPYVIALPAAAAGPGGPGGYGPAAGPDSGQTDPGTANTGTISCSVPSDAPVFAGLGATLTVSAGEAKDVITVPLTAVKGSVKDGIVWIVDPAKGGQMEQRKVQLGLSDGTKVEVASGLSENELVMEFVPGVAAPGALGQPGYSPMGG